MLNTTQAVAYMYCKIILSCIYTHLHTLGLSDFFLSPNWHFHFNSSLHKQQLVKWSVVKTRLLAPLHRCLSAGATCHPSQRPLQIPHTTTGMWTTPRGLGATFPPHRRQSLAKTHIISSLCSGFFLVCATCGLVSVWHVSPCRGGQCMSRSGCSKVTIEVKRCSLLRNAFKENLRRSKC